MTLDDVVRCCMMMARINADDDDDRDGDDDGDDDRDDDGDDDDGDDDQDEEEELCEAINDHEMPDETFTFQLSPDPRPALAPPDFCYHCH